MYKLMIFKELRENFLDLRFQLTLILLIVSGLFLGLFISIDFMDENKDYFGRIQAHEENLRVTKNVVELFQNGIWVEGKPKLSSMLIRGAADQIETSIWMSLREPPTVERNFFINPASVIFSNIDFLYFTGIIISLVTIILSFNVINGELEGGTLKLLFSSQTPRYKIIIGKWIGRYLSVIIPFFILILVFTLVFVSVGNFSLRKEDLLILFGFVVFSLFYIAAFHSLSFLVSSLIRQSSASLILLLFLWIVFLFIIPNYSPYIAERIYNVPSYTEIEINKQLAFTKAEKNWLEAHKIWQKTLAILPIKDAGKQIISVNKTGLWPKKSWQGAWIFLTIESQKRD